MPLDQALHQGDILRIRDRLQVDSRTVAARRSKQTAFIPYVGDAACHACGKVPTRAAEYDDGSLCHILAAVIPDPLDNGRGSGVSDRKSLARNAAEIGLASGRAVKHGIPDNDVFFRSEVRILRRINNDLSSGESFARVIVRVSFKRQRDSGREKGAKALTGGSGESEAHPIFRQPFGPVAPRHFAAQHGADRAMYVPDRQRDIDGCAGFKRRAGMADQRVIQRLIEAVILRRQAAAAHASGNRRAVKNR